MAYHFVPLRGTSGTPLRGAPVPAVLAQAGKGAGWQRLLIQGTLYGPCAALEHMGVDHGGFDILVTEQFLDGTDVVTILEKLGGEGMAEGMRGNGFVQASGQRSLTDSLLHHRD